MTERWYSYECHNPDCSESAHNGRTGVVMDVRLPDLPEGQEGPPPHAECPVCLEYTTFKSHWPADEHGYGSQGDTRPPVFGWVEKQMDSIEARPGMWGPPIAVECQYLLLIETRIALTVGPDRIGKEGVELHRQWQKLIKEAGGHPVSPFADQFEGYDKLVESLSRLRRMYA